MTEKIYIANQLITTLHNLYNKSVERPSVQSIVFGRLKSYLTDVFNGERDVEDVHFLLDTLLAIVGERNSKENDAADNAGATGLPNALTTRPPVRTVNAFGDVGYFNQVRGDHPAGAGACGVARR